jgi:hypothetical protein
MARKIDEAVTRESAVLAEVQRRVQHLFFKKPVEVYSQSPEGIGGFNHHQNNGQYFGELNPQARCGTYGLTILKGG